MSTQPTVGELATRATTLISGLTEEMARAFIRSNNIRSNTKLDSLVTEQLTGKNETELKALCVEAPAQGRAAATTKKPAGKKTAAKTAKTKDAKPKFERQGRTKRTTAVNEGPRGFRFGPTWCASVQAGEGIALLEVHRPKLVKHAESLGVNANTIAGGDPLKIAKAIASKLEKQA